MSYPKNCPKCGVDFQGDEIPEKDREHFGNHTHFSRVIGVEIQGTDRLCYWHCPDCKHEWPVGEGKL
jgi:hypothetical protein